MGILDVHLGHRLVEALEARTASSLSYLDDVCSC